MAVCLEKESTHHGRLKKDVISVLVSGGRVQVKDFQTWWTLLLSRCTQHKKRCTRKDETRPYRISLHSRAPFGLSSAPYLPKMRWAPLGRVTIAHGLAKRPVPTHSTGAQERPAIHTDIPAWWGSRSQSEWQAGSPPSAASPLRPTFCVPAQGPAQDQGQAVRWGTQLTSAVAPPSLSCSSPGVQFHQTLFPADKAETIPPLFLLGRGGKLGRVTAWMTDMI